MSLVEVALFVEVASLVGYIVRRGRDVDCCCIISVENGVNRGCGDGIQNGGVIYGLTWRL